MPAAGKQILHSEKQIRTLIHTAGPFPLMCTN